jgi:hypothetical protein
MASKATNSALAHLGRANLSPLQRKCRWVNLWLLNQLETTLSTQQICEAVAVETGCIDGEVTSGLRFLRKRGLVSSESFGGNQMLLWGITYAGERVCEDILDSKELAIPQLASQLKRRPSIPVEESGKSLWFGRLGTEPFEARLRLLRRLVSGCPLERQFLSNAEKKALPFLRGRGYISTDSTYSLRQKWVAAPAGYHALEKLERAIQQIITGLYALPPDDELVEAAGGAERLARAASAPELRRAVLHPRGLTKWVQQDGSDAVCLAIARSVLVAADHAS